MAKSKTKAAKTEEAVKPEPIAAEVAVVDHLHPDHLRSLEVSERDVQNAKLLMAVEEQHLKNLMLQSKIAELEIEKQKLRLEAISQKFEIEKKKYHNIKNDIFVAYPVLQNQKSLSYDSITGKIITGDMDGH